MYTTRGRLTEFQNSKNIHGGQQTLMTFTDTVIDGHAVMLFVSKHELLKNFGHLEDLEIGAEWLLDIEDIVDDGLGIVYPLLYEATPIVKRPETLGPAYHMQKNVSHRPGPANHQRDTFNQGTPEEQDTVTTTKDPQHKREQQNPEGVPSDQTHLQTVPEDSTKTPGAKVLEEYLTEPRDSSNANVEPAVTLPETPIDPTDVNFDFSHHESTNGSDEEQVRELGDKDEIERDADAADEQSLPLDSDGVEEIDPYAAPDTGDGPLDM